jgi:glycosyltransferase involved in cell wall biosynthesis
MKDEVIDIVLTAWEREEFTQKALLSIKHNTFHPYRLILIDNGSKHQGWLTQAKMDGLIDILILMDKNYGLETAKNLAMNFVESDLFVSTDNDILASSCWLKKLKLLMQRYPNYGAIACRPQVLVGTGDIFKDTQEDVLEFTHIPGYLRLMKTDLVRKTGAWKDKRPLRGHEEYWISQKLREMGHQVGWAVNVPCYHMFGQEGDWGYTGLEPEDHGHNPVGGLPRDNENEMKQFL